MKRSATDLSQWLLSSMTYLIYKIKWETVVGNEEIDLILAEYLEQQADYEKYKRKIRKSRTGSSWRNQPYLFTFSLSKRMET